MLLLVKPPPAFLDTSFHSFGNAAETRRKDDCSASNDTLEVVMAISRLIRFMSFSVEVIELEDCCKWDLYKNVSVSTSSLNSVNTKFTFIFLNVLGLMCALVRCGIAFKVTAPLSFSCAPSTCSLHAWPPGVVKPLATNESRAHFSKRWKLGQKCRVHWMCRLACDVA